MNRMVSPKVSSKPAREDMSGLVLTSLSRQVITCRYSLLKRSYSFEAFEVPSAKLSYTFQLYCASSMTSLMDQPKLMLKDHISILLRARAILADFSSAWLKSPLAPGHMDRILSSGNKADKTHVFSTHKGSIPRRMPIQLHGRYRSERMEGAIRKTWSKQKLVCGPAKPSATPRPLLCSFSPTSFHLDNLDLSLAQCAARMFPIN